MAEELRQVGAIKISEEAFFAGCLVCPECGDTKFGSAEQTDGSLVRHCHGMVNDEESCIFKWPQSDDHKYFHLPVGFILKRTGSI